MDNKFISTENTFTIPDCNKCIHHIDGDVCKAFDKIPIEILIDDIKHDKVMPGQIGEYIFQAE